MVYETDTLNTYVDGELVISKTDSLVTSQKDVKTLGDYHVNDIGLSDTGAGVAGCSLVGIPAIGTPTWTTQCHHNSLFGSAGRATGGVLSDNSGTVDVSAGTGFIKATDSDTAELLSFNWSASLNNSVPNDTSRYFGVEYNGGNPRVVVKTSDTWNLDTEFPLGRATKEGSTLHILNNPWGVTDGMTNIIERFQAEGIIVRDANVGGLSISVTGTRNLAVTTGAVWSRLNEFTIPALDTSVTGTFTISYRSGGTWVDAAVAQYPVTQYDNNSGTLQDMTTNWYANWWVYADAEDGAITLVYPQGQYATSASAEAVNPPSDIPSHLATHGILLGRIIFRKSVDAPVSVQSAFVQQFTASLAADHGNLTGLSDDDHTQYARSDGLLRTYLRLPLSGTATDTTEANIRYNETNNKPEFYNGW